MRIGFSGRIGVGIMLFAAVADAASWLVRAIDDYPFDFYRQIDAYLPVVFLFGLALLLPSISIAIQTKRAANLAKVSLTTVGPLPPESRRDPSLDALGVIALCQSPAPGNEIPPPTLAFVPSHLYPCIFKKLGYACLLAAIIVYGGIQWWMATRNYYPFDAPIALVKGPNRTANFQINIHATYLLRLELRNDYGVSCRLWEGAAPPLRWRLLRSDSPVAEGSFDRSHWYRSDVLGRPELARGIYRLEVDSPGNCAIGAYALPRLKVEADRKSIGVDSEAYFLALAFTALGILLLLWPDIRLTEELSLQGEPRATYRGMARTNRILQPMIPARRPFFLLRVWPCGWFVVISALSIVMVILITPPTPKGLKVYIPKPGTYLLADEPWNNPPVVRVDALGNLYLNRQPVRLADLGERLEKALSLWADWTVFVDADPDVNVGDVIATVDLIHAIGGTKVLLVTPSMKKEKPELAMMPPCERMAPHPPELRLPLKWREHRFYEYPVVSFVVDESGEVSNIKIKRKGDLPEFTEWLVRSARKLKYPPAPGCGKHELYLGYYW